MKIGLRLDSLQHAAESIRKTAALGIHSCQLCSFDPSLYTEARAREILDVCAQHDMSISTFWAGWSGPGVWNFTEGPLTLGLLPPAFRHRRVRELKAGADFARLLGVKQIATHVGFIPENPHDPEFVGLTDAVREVAEHCAKNGQRFLYETGQETPVALLRAIEVVGTGNLGINLDTANPILYGKANPVDMLDILGDYVYDLHIKDGLWPTDGWSLGREVPIGQGRADFPAIIRRLKEMGYDGALTIEREITGEQQIHDVLLAKELLEGLLAAQ